MSNLKKLWWLVRTGRWSAVLETVRRWWHEDSVALGLAFDPSRPPAARVPLTDMTMRPLEPSDVPVFTDTSSGDPLVRVNARHLLESGLRGCYVGVVAGAIAYMQYLIPAGESDRVQEVFGGLFPPLAPNEALLEFAFTLEAHRGGAVMPTAVVRLMEIARTQGVERVVTWVSCDQMSFIRFFLRFGFEPIGVRMERRRLLRRTIRFVSLDEFRAQTRLPAEHEQIRSWLATA